MLRQVIDLFEILDDPNASGGAVADYLGDLGATDVKVTPAKNDAGKVDFIEIVVEGASGRRSGGDAPTLGIIGRLGGLGARPEFTGFVSDGDGAWAALSAAAKIVRMAALGDRLQGDVIVTTQICPNAPTREHFPVRQMSSAMDQTEMNAREVLPEMEAILSLDTTKGHQTINHKGIALSPPVAEGYILKPSYDLLQIAAHVTGVPPVTFALSQQDITPYGNGLYHMNSILQPSTATSAPVVGVAIVTETAPPGCATGASHHGDVELAARFAVETAKYFGEGSVSFVDQEEFALMKELYGDMAHFQKIPG